MDHKKERVDLNKKEIVPKPESNAGEVLPKLRIDEEQKMAMARENVEKIADARKQIESATETMAEDSKATSLSVVTEDQMTLSVNDSVVTSFLTTQGLSEKQIADLQIEFTNLPQSNRVTRFIASFLPGRIREIFTRILSLKGDTLKIFTNNLNSIYDAGDAELIARDTIHHLVHFAQKKRKEVGFFTRLLTRLPIIHGLSEHEKEARNIAKEADLENGPWKNIVQYSNQREQKSNRLKIKI